MNKHTQELRKKDDKELSKLLGEKREALRGVRFGAKGSRSRNTKSEAALRKDIARILTLQGGTQ